jgi:isopentenyldiphosphate isomerase
MTKTVINPEEVEDWKWMAIDDVKDASASGNLHRMV